MATCSKYNLNEGDGNLEIYVAINPNSPKPYKPGTYNLLIVTDNDSIPPINITINLSSNGILNLARQAILTSNSYSLVNWIAGDPRPPSTLLGDPITGDLTAQNISISPVIFLWNEPGFKVSAGNIGAVLMSKIKENYEDSGLFECNSENNSFNILNSGDIEVEVNLALLTDNLPENSSASLTDTKITASLCGLIPEKTCDISAFPKYITVIFNPPAGTRFNGDTNPPPIPPIIPPPPPIPPPPTDPPNPQNFPGGGGGGGGGVTPPTPPPPPIGPIIVAEPNPLVFENTDVGTVRKKTFRLINLGDQPATITSMYSTLLSEPFYFGFGIPYPFELLPNQSITGEAIFSPPTADVFEDFSQVTMDLEGADVVTCEMLVTGTGTVAGDPGEPKFKGIALTGDNDQTSDLNFGNTELNQPKEGFIRVTNTGNDPDGLTISDATIIGTDAVQFSTAIPGGSLNIPVASAVDIQVIYDPQATGDHTSQFRITSDADQGQDDPINGYNYANVFGTGTLFVPTRTLEIDGGSNFGEVIAESDPKDLAITMTNNGNSPLLIRGIFSQDPFTLNLESLGQGVITPTVIEQGAVNGVVYPRVYQYVFPTIYSLEGNGTTSPGITITFSPPSVATYSGKIFFDISSSTPLTFGDDEWNVSGVGTFAPLPPIEPEPEPEPDPEPGPDPGVDPPPNPLSPTCIERQCEIPYIYDYSVNEDNLA
jgi:hypothetical protein